VTGLKLTILTPVYNEARFLPGYLAQIMGQTFQNWELILINDGSTDETPQLLEQAAQQDARIRVFHQKNQGQQMALLSALRHITGDVVLLAHADDELTSPEALAANMRYFQEDTALDGLIGDFITIDAHSQETGRSGVPDTVDDQAMVRLMLGKGGNFLHDHFFCRRQVLFQQVLKNYLLWNVPYWVSFDEGQCRPLNLKKTETPWYRYRVYNQNYQRTPVGQFVMTNGCLRSVLELSRYYHRLWPWYKWFKAMRQYVRPGNASYKEKLRLIRGVMRVYYPNKLPSDVYHKAVLGFYQHPSRRRIAPPSRLSAKDIWYGKDVVRFYEAVQENTLSPIYQWVLAEAQQGFGSVMVDSEVQKRYWQRVLYFLNLQAAVQVKRHG